MCREYTNLRLVLIVLYQETQGDVQRVHQPQVSAYSAVSGDTGRCAESTPTSGYCL